MTPKVCSGCRQTFTPHNQQSRCDTCTARYQRTKDQRRGTAHQRGYTPDYTRARLQLLSLHTHCHYCGAPPPLVADHATPLNRGGTNELHNLRATCIPCNSRKRDMTETEYLNWMQK